MFGIEKAMLNMNGLLIVNLPKKENSSMSLAVAVPMRKFLWICSSIGYRWGMDGKLTEEETLWGHFFAGLLWAFWGVSGMTELDW
jgi:hypothetical protein